MSIVIYVYDLNKNLFYECEYYKGLRHGYITYEDQTYQKYTYGLKEGEGLIHTLFFDLKYMWKYRDKYYYKIMYDSDGFRGNLCDELLEILMNESK